MPQSITSLYLFQSYHDAWDDYNRALTRTDFPYWDYIVITASNEKQAEGFRVQLEERRALGLLPRRTHFLVISDEGNVRVGSGGATLSVIRRIALDTGREDFAGLRILCIHSGGDSKRIPQYSAMGKLFSPVPHELPNGRASTLFDEFLVSTASVAGRIREGMLLLSGDVLLLFNALLIDYPGKGAAVISIKEDVHTGKNHGVFLRGDDGNVKAFLHKQSVEKLTHMGAVNERGAVDIDTGAVIFSSDMLVSLYGLVRGEAEFRRFVNSRVRLSLYGDFLYPLATDSTLEQFYLEAPEGGYSNELIEARTAVWHALRPYRMKLLRLAPAKFIHFGTTGEILGLLNEDIASYHQLGWSKRVNSSISADVAGYCSVLSGKARLGKNCYLEVSYVHHDAVIGDNTVLSYIDVHDETIPSNVVLHGLKQNDGRFVVRIFGISDNPKARLGDGGSFFECGFDAFLENNGIRPEELWDGTERDIWNARLYPVCKTIQEALAAALNVHAMSCGKGDVQAWRRAERTSLCSGFNNADPHALIAWNNRMRELVQMDRLSQLIRNRNSAVQGKDILKSGYLTSVQQEWLDKNIARADYSEAMRLYYYVGTAIGGSVGQEYIGKCYKVLREAILAGGAYGLEYNASCVIRRDVHTVRMPLRVNWGGGWSDTPPYCNENGGTVLNAAILLDGHMPVEVTLTRLQEKKIVVDSRDMDVHGEFMHIKDLQATGDPYDPCALQKAALLACGIIPCSGGDLDEILTRLGGGFHMQTEVIGVPKGSGLGTSSILSAACVKAIFEFFGIDYTQDTLCNRVLCIEQIMSTGGGWQDQIGGMIPGIKFCMSYPSLNQQVRVEELKITDETLKELQERFCLIYTGQRRLARNLLRDVVGRYIGNDPDVLYALDAIQRVAALMRFELERGHVDNFVHLLNEHWDLSRKIDAGSSNTLIDQIFDSIIDLIDGKMICGAGGGGFLQVVLKRGITTEQVHARLKDVFQDSDIDVWKCTLV